MEWINEIIPENYLYAIGWMLVHSLWQIAGLGVVLWFSLGFLQNKSAAFKYRMGVISLFVLVLSSISTSIFYFEPASESTATQEIFIPENAAIYLPTDFEAPQTSQTTFEVLSEQIERRIPALVNLWLIGAILFMVKFGGSLAELRSLSSKPKKEIDGKWKTALIDFSQKLKVKQTVKLFQSKFVYSPVTYGVFKPVILIPAGLIFQLSPNQLEAIIAHELAHIKRYDYLVNLMQSAMEVIFFFHPVFWYINSIIKTEREHACDDAAIQVGVHARDLAKALVIIVNHAKQSQQQLALAAAKSKTPTLDRIKRIMGFHTSHKQTSTLTSFTMMITLILSASLILGAHADKSADSKSDLMLTQIQSEINLESDFWLNFEQDENSGKILEKEIAEGLKQNLGTSLKELNQSLSFMSKAFSGFSDKSENPKSYDFKVSFSEDGKPFSFEDISEEMESKLLSSFDNYKFIGDTLHVWSDFQNLNSKGEKLKSSQSSPIIIKEFKGDSTILLKLLNSPNIKADSLLSFKMNNNSIFKLNNSNLKIESIDEKFKNNEGITHTLRVAPLEFQGDDFSAMPLLTLSDKMIIPHISIDSIKKLNPSFAKIRIGQDLNELTLAELELARVKTAGAKQIQTFNLAKIQSTPKVGFYTNPTIFYPSIGDTTDFYAKALGEAAEKLSKAKTKEEKEEAMKEISVLTEKIAALSESRKRMANVNQNDSIISLVKKQAEMAKLKAESLKPLMEEYAKEMAEWQKQYEPLMKEYQEKMKAYEKQLQPLMEEYQAKMKQFEEEARPLMQEYQQKMEEWQKANQPKIDEFHQKMKEWQKEHSLKMQELQKELEEKIKKENN
ncbi:antirepressor regulating drug resistance protein [Belliella baltica DSM 15883]|uniref:Antirepressor regulating drug resistance protein n=1 Tax=Belliella baltica (strain DSM 15883 / CIP 108006 / LMG 21964 / BA134) TaxID=866536 RepID=I3Z4R0_BELBD|nr:M56 family metallopeptidase [Belliella baltica]AFL84228.1 antirepressor regulating drug resistance protein [Belliella baltica DSM 15883]